jgi:general secretion pathway protein L
MSTLLILLPSRSRLSAGTAAPSTDAADLAYALSADGRTLTRQGHAAVSLLPRAATVVAVIPDDAISWHRIVMPKAPAAKLRAALGGMLEEQLLEDESEVHLALAPDARPGEPTWVAAVHRGWLGGHLARLEQAGIQVDRVLPSCWPGLPGGHFFTTHGGSDDTQVWLSLVDGEGAQCVALAGGLTRALQATWAPRDMPWSATPATVAAAEQWLGRPVAVQVEAERALAAARSSWNLCQFDLAPRRRSARALGSLGRRLLSPAWRPARLGLAALVLVQLVGLNAWAWHLQREVAQRQQAIVEQLRSSHPQVRAVLDAPLQMRRETESLRMAAGVPADDDLEPLLAAAASAWPDGQAPAATLRFEPGRLTLAAAGWAPPQVEQFRQRLQPLGWSVESEAGRLVLSAARAAPPSGLPPAGPPGAGPPVTGPQPGGSPTVAPTRPRTPGAASGTPRPGAPT